MTGGLVQCLSCGHTWDMLASIHVCPRAPVFTSSTTLEERVKMLEAKVVILENAVAGLMKGTDR